MTQLDQIIKDQTKFLIEQSILTTMLLTYRNNVEQFDLLFTKEVIDYYKFDFTNAEYVWESLSELCNDFINNEKNFAIKSCGIFESICFAKPKKKKLKLDEMTNFFYDTACKPWSI